MFVSPVVGGLEADGLADAWDCLENQVSYKNSTLRHCVLCSCQKPATEVRSS